MSDLKRKTCSHLNAITEVKPAKAYQCDACVEIGGTWVHLRTCQDCGTTLCCDSSPNRHARAHAESKNHHIIASAEPGERWLWCYMDELYAKY